MREIIRANVKDGIEIVQEEENVIYIKGGDFSVRRYRDNCYGFSSQYLSWENASYAYAEKGKEEINDYLLYRALQEDRKLCVSFYTKDAARIKKVFSDRQNYDYFEKTVKSEEHRGFSYVFVTKKRCLNAYYNMEKIEDIYQREAFSVNRLMNFEDIPLINFFNGKLVDSCYGVEFDTYLDTENPESDKVLNAFGREETIIVTGLLYGYPIEMTMAMLACLCQRRI